jgi:UDP-N-acetylmuramate dehydrogenase
MLGFDMKVYENVSLKNFSWIKIGGNCKKVIELENSIELVEQVKSLIRNNEKFELLGLGANTLFSDNGIDCTLLKLKSNNIKIGIEGLDRELLKEKAQKTKKVFRHEVFQNSKITSGYRKDDLKYDEGNAEDILVEVDAGVNLPYAINHLIAKGVTGLQTFAGIPGTIGASIYNNIHSNDSLLSDLVYSVKALDKSGNEHILRFDQIDFDYNHSTFQRDDLIIVSAVLHLKLGDKDRALHASIEWTKRKSSQPKNSLGSVFHNLDKETQQRVGFEIASAAYIIEHKLYLSGYRVGDIMIPEQTPPDQMQVNKNIFMNMGDGKAADFLTVMKKVRSEAYEKFGIKLKPEIFFKGFDPEEIEIFFN